MPHLKSMTGRGALAMHKLHCRRLKHGEAYMIRAYHELMQKLGFLK